VDSESSRPYF